MKYSRDRSGFWVYIFVNDSAEYNISTNSKYVRLINDFFPILEAKSPTKWKESRNYNNMSNLWLPSGCYDSNIITEFIQWCERVTNDILWLDLNKNIAPYFDDELDYCIASDFNFVYRGNRTEMGEAEYQLKYRRQYLTVEEQKEYADVIMNKMLDNCKYIPLNNGESWCISPMPATEQGKTKMAWHMAEAMARRLQLHFITPDLTVEKPQMKQLSIEDKINAWNNIFYDNGVVLDSEIKGKNIIVIDDLYQSGATMWEYAKFLKSVGAKSVFGVVCVKSLKDSDNR